MLWIPCERHYTMTRIQKTLTFILLTGSILLPVAGSAQQTPAIEDLDSKRIRLSHIDPERCIQILKIYGYHIGEPGQVVDPQKLPVIFPLPGTQSYDTVGKPGDNLPLTESDPLNELLIFYDTDQPQQLTRVIHTIDQIIDVPARQIIIEAMILEITEKSLKQLGVQWKLLDSANPLQTLTLGQSPLPSDSLPTLNMTANEIFGDFGMELQAMVESGSAEILSRPSILTLNNRMAYINVSQQIPIAEGQLNRYGELTSVKFKDKMAGIQLGVRPRISKNEREVGMQISASVTAIVPNEDVEIQIGEAEGAIASSPTISVREVKTYARIANNMPFIIGGLVAKDAVSTAGEVPWLGQLPFIGRLFRNEENTHQKREVIIVITPYILPEEETVGTQIGEKSITLRTLPKDDEAFDSFGNRLFRNSYRIRSTDLLDLDFLTENEQLKQMQRLADQAVSQNVLLKNEYPWNCFVDGHVPGEQILVFRQMYEVIQRTKLDEKMETGKIAFLGTGRLNGSGFHGQFLERFLEETADRFWEQDHAGQEEVRIPEDLWKRMGKRAVALTYTIQNKSIDSDHLLNEPTPELQVFDCPDPAEHDRLLWSLNQPAGNGQERHTLLISGPDDIVRLKRSILLRQTADLNATQKSLTLDNFTIGQNLLLPNINNDHINLIDSNVAKYYFYSDLYYQALRQELDKDTRVLQLEVENQKEP